MFRKLSTCGIVAIVAALVIAHPVESGTATRPSTWGAIKSLYRSDGSVRTVPSDVTTQLINRLNTATTDAEAEAVLNEAPPEVRAWLTREQEAEPIVEPPPPAWEHPVAKLMMEKFGIKPTDVLTVQRVVALDGGLPVDSADVVVTPDRWYYASLTDGTLSDSPTGGFNKVREIDIYGTWVENYGGSCWWSEWTVSFFLPVCFHEISPGRFDNIIDAWAPNPPCGQCNGGVCAAYQCGIAWDGPGYNGWRNYGGCADGHWAKKVGKMVQKRWLFTWRNCGYVDWQIASWVRARIRY